MPVDSQHKSYESYTKKWQRARDASIGQDAVHGAGKRYLPMLSGQTIDEYAGYLTRTSYFNATGRTVDGLVGMVSRKEPVIDATGLDNLTDDIDLQGNKLNSIAQSILREVITVGRWGALVEYPKMNDDSAKTLAQKELMNERPYASIYPTESIINWETKRINNKMQFTFIMLKESRSEAVDEYESEDIDQWRELRLTNAGIYIQKVWERKGKTKEFVQIGADITPLMNSKPLTHIPFFAFGSDENSLNVTDSPILPLADLNLAHYRVTADYENVSHFSGCPTLLIAGITLGENESVKVGSTEAIVAPDAQAHGEYIEVSGDASVLEKNLERKEKQMAAIGARFLESQKSGVEAEGAMQMRANGENSVLAGIAKLVADQLSNMLTFMAQWAGNNSDVTVTLNTDYMPVGMSAQQLTALVGSWQSGAISKQVLFENLKRGEIISEGTTFEDEEENKATEMPVLAEDGS